MSRASNTTRERATPLTAAQRGLVAGLAATALLSVLARVLPGLGSRADSKPGNRPQPPRDRFDPKQVREWQERAQSPAAFQPKEKQGALRHPASPASALRKPQSPGPEGLAEQFAFKFAAGLFDTDISPHVKTAGVAVHAAYGSMWGMLFGLYQASRHRPPLLLGALYGLGVWAVGPGYLVPAMKLMGKPTEEPPLRTAMLVAGHLAYGVALAESFERLDREA